MYNHYLEALWVCVIISLASSSISITITLTELFLPLRNYANKLGHMIGYLFHCFYCMSHWIVIVGVLIYQPILIDSSYLVINLIVSIFTTITLSTFISGLVFKVFLNAMNYKIKEKELTDILSRENTSDSV